MKRLLARSALALLLSTPLVAPSHATTVLKVDVKAMTSLSEWVVRGRVVSVDNVVAADSGGPFTDVKIALDEVYRGPQNHDDLKTPDGAAPKELVIRLMGGKMDGGLAMKVPGMPRFAVGDAAVFFLERTATGLIPAGLEQGVWRLVKGPFGYEVVQQTVFDLNLVVRTADGKLVPDAHGPHRSSCLLSSLVAEIRGR
jgi:hypothetical protein